MVLFNVYALGYPDGFIQKEKEKLKQNTIQYIPLSGLLISQQSNIFR